MERPKQNALSSQENRGRWKKLLLIILLAAAALTFLVLRLAPIGDRTITLTALNKKSDLGEGTEIWLKSVLIDGVETAPEDVLEGTWVSENGYYKWRDFDQADGMTDSLTMTVPAGTDVDFLFESNRWRGVVRVHDGYIIQGLYDVNCWSSSDEGDHLISYREVRMAPGPIRVIRLLMIYLVCGLAFMWIRDAKRASRLKRVAERKALENRSYDTTKEMREKDEGRAPDE